MAANRLMFVSKYKGIYIFFKSIIKHYENIKNKEIIGLYNTVNILRCFFVWAYDIKTI